MSHSPPPNLDLWIFRWVNGAGWPPLDSVWVALSSRAFGLAAGTALLALVVFRQRRRAGRAVLAALLGVGFADLLGARLFKPLIGRVRPSFALAEDLVRVLVPAANTGSMPSNHAATSFAMATVVTLAERRLGWVAWPLAVAISLSRVGVGVHWPSDLLGGAALGMTTAAGAWWLSGLAWRWWSGRGRASEDGGSPD